MTEITFTSVMGVEHIDHMGSDETVARAARVSTGRDRLERGKIEGLIGYLMRHQHTSTVEHCTLTVRVHVPTFEKGGQGFSLRALSNTGRLQTVVGQHIPAWFQTVSPLK